MKDVRQKLVVIKSWMYYYYVLVLMWLLLVYQNIVFSVVNILVGLCFVSEVNQNVKSVGRYIVVLPMLILVHKF
jgi:hypothetical protein